MEDGSAPINAVSVVIPFDESGKRFKHPKVFTFLLRNHIRYKEQEYFENHLDKFIEECHEEFDEKYDKPQLLINTLKQHKNDFFYLSLSKILLLCLFVTAKICNSKIPTRQ